MEQTTTATQSKPSYIFPKRRQKFTVKGLSPYAMQHSDATQKIGMLDKNKVCLSPCGSGTIWENCKNSETGKTCLDIEIAIQLFEDPIFREKITQELPPKKVVIILCGGTTFILGNDTYIPYFEYTPKSDTLAIGLIPTEYAGKVENAFLLVF
ncbi:MAG TPA: hypothetical protein VLB02_02155 [Candidatus Paceibacterota bacterium]|nr:hypothetical protein [Candidatus Paceibacterota bacterium]